MPYQHVQTLSVFASIVHSVLLTCTPIGFVIGLSEPYVSGFILLLTCHHASWMLYLFFFTGDAGQCICTKNLSTDLLVPLNLIIKRW